MQNGGASLAGIGVLDETYIVADSGTEKIYECPLTSVGISKSNCEVFAYRPQGKLWDPMNLLVDPIKRLVYDPSSPAHAALTASVVIPYAGDWTLDVTQGTYNVQHFLGSPQLVTVAPAGTDPASCVVDFPNGRIIVAGNPFDAVIMPFDEFKNPTSHPEDSFKSRVELGNSEENFGNRHVLPADHTFSEMQTIAGAYKLYLYHANTQREVAGSPIGFDVRPAPPSAVNSTHNIDFDKFESRNISKVMRIEDALDQQGQVIQRFSESKKRLEQVNQELEEEVRLKKHSEEELKVMVSALEAVSKERQDELKEVMMESKELKIDRLLGKGGFGVVNLATYRGAKVAMKQLLTVNEENVLRFRHECFLMKNLSHPNVVKLVGVCWSEDLFACCLEFVENGSLEDWLRRTVGGKVYKSKEMQQAQAAKKATLEDRVYLGFNSEGADLSSLLASKDVDHANKTKAKFEEWIAATSSPAEFKKTWKTVLSPDGSPLEHGIKCYWRYVGKYGESFSMVEINAKPAQIMAFLRDHTRLGKMYKGFDVTAATRKIYSRFDQSSMALDNRDALTQSVVTTYPDGSIMESARSIKDERYPDRSKKKKNKVVRMDLRMSAFMVVEKPGSSGGSPVSVCYKMNVSDPKLSGVASLFGGVAATAAAKLNVAPMISTKETIEKILAE
ncbi:hypothetical protein TeGR_g7083 [Tetraparma gracilis]|uniref:Protein kinase domain-containing protein n=1 Tax=Tetraparma gracilis TaxID=2962635 RepID=A0ABQ6M6D8_9STRA|nr:hypothetical protein TeGR_g7083 [Tetraparma gracilis]